MSQDPKALSEALRGTLGKMEAVLGSLRDIILWTDSQGNLQWCNETLVRLLGRSRLSLLGKPVAELLPLLEVGEEVPGPAHPVRRCLETQADQKGMYTLAVGKDALDPEVVLEATYLRSPQGGTGAALVIRPAEEESDYEQNRLQSLALTAAVNAIAIMDARGRVRWVNPAFKRMTGYSLREIYGRKLNVLKSGRQSQAFYKDLWKTVLAGFSWRGELVNRHKNGRNYVEYQTITPVKDKSGRITHFISVKQDVTSRKMMERSLMENNRLLEVLRRDLEARIEERTRDLESKTRQLSRAQKLESIGQLAAGIAHEVNTPIQYVGDNIRFFRTAFEDALRLLKLVGPLADRIRGVSELAKESKALDRAVEDADVEFYLEEIPKAMDQALEGIERVTAIVQAMKRFSHVEDITGSKAVDLNKALENTVTVARNEWKYTADVHLKPDPDLPLVTCLPGDINQVFLNVLINAAHAVSDRWSGSGEKGSIVISTARDGDWAEVRVQDNGAGIPEKIRERIFDPFFTTKEVGKGSGQGLALAHAVMEKHGGSVDFESQEGQGTTFIIRLPVNGPPAKKGGKGKTEGKQA